MKKCCNLGSETNRIRTLPFDVSGDLVFVALTAEETLVCCGAAVSGGLVSNNLCKISFHIWQKCRKYYRLSEEVLRR